MLPQIAQLLQSKSVGIPVVFNCWAVSLRRIANDLTFVPVRDSTGTIQAVFQQNICSQVTPESVLQIKGVLAKRSEERINKHALGGDLEVQVQEWKLLNACAPLPFTLTASNGGIEAVREDLRAKYRYLDLRANQSLQKNLQKRNEVTREIRAFLHEESFLEVETPILFKSSAEGASEFAVASAKHDWWKFALPQSPQQFKQMLMIGGIPRYFQIARCFRDEDLRADRQPEFTQVDIEMAFAEQEDVILLTERLLGRIFLLFTSEPVPIQRMTFKEAMRKYGSDKPDLRIEGLEIVEEKISLCLSRFRMTYEEAKKDFPEYVCIEKTSDKDFILILPSANANEGFLTCSSLGKFRNFFADYVRQNKGIQVRKVKYAAACITDFPLFYREESGKLCSVHHPFTAPKECDLAKNPEEMTALHYDFVLNGVEIGGGSVRVHNAALQRRIFQDWLKLDQSEFAQFLEALSLGAPPHAGVAIGLDRLLAVLLECKSIKQVLAFPKNNQGYDACFDFPERENCKDQLSLASNYN